MAINYRTIQAGGTSTDLNVSVEGLDLFLEMNYYTSGIHQLRRSGEAVLEFVTLESTHGVDAKVTIYLEDAPETIEVEAGVFVTRNEGQFVVDICRLGIDQPYQPENLIMYVGEFTIPKTGIGSLDEVEISIIKVVGGSN